MTSLFYADPELIIALNRKVIFVNPSDLQIFKEIELPADLREFGLKTLKSCNEAGRAVEGSNKQSKTSKKSEELNIDLPSILHVKLSPDRRLCAVTTAGQKAVLLYECRPEHAKLVSARPMARASSALTFNSDSNVLLVTDKSGDCYKYDCRNLEEGPQLLLGHLSIVYDVLWTPNAKYIITCDRDDKIRVTNYPETHDIHGYCLGHTEFVSGLGILDKDTIVSVSGDKTLRIWDFVSGREVSIIDLAAPALRLCLRSIDDNTFQAAVLLYQPDDCIGIYELRKNDSEKWTITECEVLKCPEIIVSNICFVDESIYATGIVEERFSLKIANLSGKVYQVPENWCNMIDDQFKSEVWQPEDISAWFKKRYDNVSEYLERKKKRIEEKQK